VPPAHPALAPLTPVFPEATIGRGELKGTKDRSLMLIADGIVRGKCGDFIGHVVGR
jgi:hypothetical protein